MNDYEQNACDFIEAMFVYGPMRCGNNAVSVVEVDGETFFVCADHAEAGDK